MTELLLLQLRCAPYRGAGRAGAPNAVAAAAAAGSAGVGGAAAAAAAVAVGPSPPLPWLTIIPQVSLLGGRPTTAAATPPFWSSSIVICCCFCRPGRASPRSLGTVVDRRNLLETDEAFVTTTVYVRIGKRKRTVSLSIGGRSRRNGERTSASQSSQTSTAVCQSVALDGSRSVVSRGVVRRWVEGSLSDRGACVVLQHVRKRCILIIIIYNNKNATIV